MLSTTNKLIKFSALDTPNQIEMNQIESNTHKHTRTQIANKNNIRFYISDSKFTIHTQLVGTRI